MVEKGEFSTIPTVEANVSPVEGTANGVIVADASIPISESVFWMNRYALLWRTVS